MCSFSFHFHQAKDWPSKLETNMHSMFGAFFNSAMLLKYLDIFIQYIMGNAFILFDVTMSLVVVDRGFFFWGGGYFHSGSCLFQSDMRDYIILELKMYAVANVDIYIYIYLHLYLRSVIY